MNKIIIDKNQQFHSDYYPISVLLKIVFTKLWALPMILAWGLYI